MGRPCSLCDELGELSGLESVRSFFEDSRVFAYNERLCMFPTVGCFKLGYILLVTTKHYISLYKCPAERIIDVSEAVKMMRGEFARRLKCDMVLFEHGTIDDKSLSSASVSHFHMHLLPFEGKLWDKINKKYGFDYIVLDSLCDIKRAVEENGIKAYILFGDTDGKLYLIDCTHHPYPSQFMRKVMYEEYFPNAPEEWDWKSFPFYDNMKETIRLFDGVSL